MPRITINANDRTADCGARRAGPHKLKELLREAEALAALHRVADSLAEAGEHAAARAWWAGQAARSNALHLGGECRKGVAEGGVSADLWTAGSGRRSHQPQHMWLDTRQGCADTFLSRCGMATLRRGAGSGPVSGQSRRNEPPHCNGELLFPARRGRGEEHIEGLGFRREHWHGFLEALDSEGGHETPERLQARLMAQEREKVSAGRHVWFTRRPVGQEQEVGLELREGVREGQRRQQRTSREAESRSCIFRPTISAAIDTMRFSSLL